MAILSMFYGIIVSMYLFDQRRHHAPHVHVKYQNAEAVIAIAMYKRMIKKCGDDTTTRRMLEEILADEEGHADQWETLLDIQK